MAATAANLTGSLDATRTIPARIEGLGMSQGFFAEVCGSNKAEFSRLMNGVKPISGTQTEQFYKTLDALEELTQFFDVVPIAWNDAQTIRELLRGFGLLPGEAKQNIKSGLEILRGA
jgi:hypothetical protein